MSMGVASVSWKRKTLYQIGYDWACYVAHCRRGYRRVRTVGGIGFVRTRFIAAGYIGLSVVWFRNPDYFGAAVGIAVIVQAVNTIVASFGVDMDWYWIANGLHDVGGTRVALVFKVVYSFKYLGK